MRSDEALAIIRVEAPHHLDQDAAMALGSLAHDTAAPVETGPPPHNEERIGGVLDRHAARSASDDANGAADIGSLACARADGASEKCRGRA